VDGKYIPSVVIGAEILRPDALQRYRHPLDLISPFFNQQAPEGRDVDHFTSAVGRQYLDIPRDVEDN